MTLREYLDHMTKMAKENPEILDQKVFYSPDEEGNDMKPVCYGAAPFAAGDYTCLGVTEAGVCIN